MLDIINQYILIDKVNLTELDYLVNNPDKYDEYHRKDKTKLSYDEYLKNLVKELVDHNKKCIDLFNRINEEEEDADVVKDKKECMIRIRVTKEEMNDFKRRAEAMNITLSKYILDCIKFYNEKHPSI